MVSDEEIADIFDQLQKLVGRSGQRSTGFGSGAWWQGQHYDMLRQERGGFKMSQLLSNRYLLEEKIGSGGRLLYYRARDLQTKQTVAIKVLREEYTKDTEFVSRFDREAKAMQRVRHNNIVEVYAVGNDYGIPYIVMEYIDGPTLKDILRMRGKLPVRQCIQIMLNLCEAIQTAHDNGVIHRDLKPHNILVTPEGEVKNHGFMALPNLWDPPP